MINILKISAEEIIEAGGDLEKLLPLKITLQQQRIAEEIIRGHVRNILLACGEAGIPLHLVGMEFMRAGVEIIGKDCYESQISVEDCEELLKATTDPLITGYLKHVYEEFGKKFPRDTESSGSS